MGTKKVLYHALLICASIHIAADLCPGIAIQVVELGQVLILRIRPLLLPDFWIDLLQTEVS